MSVGADGQPVRVAGTAVDATVRACIEQTLAEAERLHPELFERTHRTSLPS